nr:MAG TPA: hypothetical protein [Bacteriophage sp.]
MKLKSSLIRRFLLYCINDYFYLMYRSCRTGSLIIITIYVHIYKNIR